MNSRAKVYQYARPVKVAIVGGGFGGLCMAIKLREAGIEDFVLLEKAEQVGGTWRDNSYPGCACDVQSHMYSFSFSPPRAAYSHSASVGSRWTTPVIFFFQSQ